MRKLMWFTVGFSAACLAGIYWMNFRWLVPLFLLCALLALCLLLDKSVACRILSTVLLGCALAFFWMWIFDSVYLSHARAMDGAVQSVTVTIHDHSKTSDFGICADGVIELEGKDYRIRIYADETLTLQPGDRVTGNFRLRFTPGAEEEMTYHPGSGIFLLGYLQDGTVSEGKLPLAAYPALWKQKILTLLSRLFPEDTLPFAQALLLGEKSLLDYSTNTALSVSGIRHVVAVSGLHVSILCAVILGLVGYHRILTPVISAVVLFLFAALTGFTPSVVRAGIMYFLMIAGRMTPREYDPLTAMSFAVLVMLVVNPMAVTSVGLQLSVCCVVGIVLFAGKIQSFILRGPFGGKSHPKSLAGRLKRWIAGSVSVTLSTWITATPLCAIYFGTVSLIGVVTNLLTLWVITVTFCALMALVVLGTICFPLAKHFAQLISWLIRYVLLVAKTLASIPCAAVYTTSVYIVIWLVFSYILLGAFFWTKKKRPVPFLACMVAGLALSLLASWAEPRMDDYRMTVMNVGQGQSILLQNQDRYYLVDCGGDSETQTADLVARTLLGQGITHLDGVIVSHYDEDHAGAVKNLLERVPAKMLYLPMAEDENAIRKELEQAYPDRILWIGEGKIETLAQADITIIPPMDNTGGNENSMCVLFQPGNCDILITADRDLAGERKLLEQLALPRLEVLVAGHHGAKNATSLELLYATKPALAVISVGENNPYGHPSKETLDRLELFGCRVLRTDQNGTILIRG